MNYFTVRQNPMAPKLTNLVQSIDCFKYIFCAMTSPAVIATPAENNSLAKLYAYAAYDAQTMNCMLPVSMAPIITGCFILRPMNLSIILAKVLFLGTFLSIFLVSVCKICSGS